MQLPTPTPFPTKPIVQAETRQKVRITMLESKQHVSWQCEHLPELHVQVNPPAVFLQDALGSQGLLAHSSLSEHVKPSPV